MAAYHAVCGRDFLSSRALCCIFVESHDVYSTTTSFTLNHNVEAVIVVNDERPTLQVPCPRRISSRLNAVQRACCRLQNRVVYDGSGWRAAGEQLRFVYFNCLKASTPLREKGWDDFP